MATDSDSSREHGIEFGSLVDDLEGESYPLSHETLLEQYGDHELGLVGDQVALREVLSPETQQTYEDAESVQQAVLNMVGDAVGREEYSDRGGSAANAADSNDAESF